MMSTITMHGVDKAIDQGIREIARAERTSINRVAQALLRRALGLDTSVTDHRAEFQDVFGKWSKADLAEFEAATSGFSKIDAKDWK
jgi:hypothetical protein